MVKLLVVENQRACRNSLVELLSAEHYGISSCATLDELKTSLSKTKFDVIIYSSRFPGMDGFAFMEYRKSIELDTPVLMILPSGDLEVDMLVKYMKDGVEDVIERPVNITKLLITLRKVIKNRRGTEKNFSPSGMKRHCKGSSIPEITGRTPKIIAIRKTIEKVADSDARVLITGANGTGKELVARWLHQHSSRNTEPLIEVNCAAIPNDLIESVLFGHEKGSFTGADARFIGHFEQANGGTLFLDEVGDMSLSAQAKVLRALQESKIGRVGGTHEIDVDVRVIAATNKNLRDEIARGTFREDLYHRLNVIHIRGPSLCERKDDIPELINHFVATFSKRQNRSIKEITPEAMNVLVERPWTGNIRELQNVIERLVILCDNTITRNDIDSYCCD